MSNLELSRAQRLDQYVTERLPMLSRAFAARLIEDGKVMVNGTVTLKPGYKLRPNDHVGIDYDPLDQPAIPEITIPILYEDDDCVVINKPLGILTHSKGAYNPEATVATWLRSRLEGLAGERAGIVHRLDRATSGVMICAKNAAALSWLQKQFSQRRVKKTYLAVISGQLPHAEAVIDMPIERNPKHPQTFRVGTNGKAAVTAYTVLASTPTASLVELRPTTGRTHQLRVHLSHLGHPIIGDTLYGGKTGERLYLHAIRLEITLPSRQRQSFEAAEPKDFRKALANE